MCNFEEYDASKAEAEKLVRAKIQDVVSELANFDSLYGYDGSGTDRNLKLELIGSVMKDEAVKLNHFTYSDVYYGRCGDREGSYSGLITWLSEHELKQHMLAFAKQTKDYCHHRFLASMSAYGFYYHNHDESSDFSCVEYETSLNNVSEKDIYSEVEFAELKRQRDEAAKKKQDAEEAQRKAAVEKRERDELDRLKSKYERGCNV
jgi:hypothetical protein